MSMALGGRVRPEHAAAHGRDRADDFVEGLAAHPQRHQEGAALGGRDFAGEQVVEGGAGLLAGQRRAGGDLGEVGLEGIHRSQCTARAARRHACRVPGRCEIEEIPHDRHAVLREDALGMELHAMDRQASGGTAP